MTVINLHSILWKSKANGPGLRTVLWFQGCSLGCTGCFNPLMHPFDPVNLYNPTDLAHQIIIQSADADGITISGGEPLQQREGLLELIEVISRESNLSIILFSGYDKTEIEQTDQGECILDLTDVLIAGRYNHQLQIGSHLCGSTNKKIHFLSNRFKISDFDLIPGFEIIIKPNAEVVLSGIKDFKLSR